MQLTPYDALTTAHCCKAGGSAVEPSDIVGIDPLHERWIRLSLLDNRGILYPHKIQICAIHDIAFHCDQIIHLIAKTGSGKLAVPLTVGSLQTGVTVRMVPLVGLGSNQVKNGCNEDNLIKAYHLEKHRGNDGKALRDWLQFLSDDEADHVSIFCMLLPNPYRSKHFGISACQPSHCVI
jgi:hypothetical protein